MFHSFYQDHAHFIEKPINQLYIAMAIRAFGISIIGLFIPIYLSVELGYSVEQTLSYFISLAFFFLIFSPISGIISHKIGIKHTMFLSTPFYVVGYALLYLLATYTFPLWLVGMFAGIGSALFWVSYHYTFLIESDKNHLGEEVGIRFASHLIAHFFGPIFGGYLLMLYGFFPVFIIGSLLLFLSSYIVLLSKDIKTKDPFILSHYKIPKISRLMGYYISRGVIDAVRSTIWPLILFSILKSYVSLGAVSSIVTLINIVIVINIGKWVDLHPKSILLKISSVGESINWAIRPFLISTSQIIATSVFGSLFMSIIEPISGSLEYARAVQEENKVLHFIQREIYISIGRLIALTIGYLFFSEKLLLWLSAISHLFIFLL